MASDTAYAPFGEHYAAAGTTDLSFTGQNQDTASGIYDFPARELGEVSGRWPSPDPAGMAAVNPGDPQTWNRYAYVRNSPLNLTDPTGMIIDAPPIDPGCDWDFCGGGGGGPCAIDIGGIICIGGGGGGGGEGGGDGGGGGGGVSAPGAPPEPAPEPFPLDTNNALNEIDGLPAGYQLPQLSVWCLVSPACSGPPLVIQNFTIQEGITYTWTFWGITFFESFGIVVDLHGHRATYSTFGLGVGLGADVQGAVSQAFSDAYTVCGIAGPFTQISGTLGVEGASGTLDTFFGPGPGPGGEVIGTGSSVGVGGGADASWLVTTTQVHPFGNFSCGGKN